MIDAASCPGAFLINHDFPVEPFVPILREIRTARPDLWLWVSFLDKPGSIAFPILGSLAREGIVFDAYWADDARIDEREAAQAEADEIARIRAESGWTGLYLGGGAFKKQRPVPEARYAEAAQLSTRYLDVVCTSGIATGHEAELSKIATFRKAIGDVPLAIASGITPQNIHRYKPFVDIILVATGINFDGDFYSIDPARLDALLAVTREKGEFV